MRSRTTSVPPSAGHRRRLSTMALLTGAALLMLSGCSGTPSSAEDDGVAAPTDKGSSSSSQQEPSAQQEPPGADAGTATVAIDGREFTFRLQSCVFDGDREVELSGPGGETGSDTPSYLDGGLVDMDAAPLGEFRVDIGVDGPFQSSDEFLALGSSDGADLTVSRDGDDYLVTGNAWDDTGAGLGTGTLRFRCD